LALAFNVSPQAATFHCNRFASPRVYISVLIDTFRTRLSRRQALSRHASSPVFPLVFTGGFAMTRSNSAHVLRRVSERASAGAAALALSFLTLITCDVRASEPATPPSITVSYSDAAFGTRDGTARVYKKLKNAARKVCGMSRGVQLALDRRVAGERCVEKALADAVQRIDRPMLTSVHSTAARKQLG
jgi:UrcA family protein